MLFLQAFCSLAIFDILSIFCSFEVLYLIVKKRTVAVTSSDRDSIQRICNAINYACTWYPRQILCFQRSFVTTYLLRIHGIPAQMVLGAQKLPFKAHAWVEVEGRAINERSNVQEKYAMWDRC